METDIVQRYPIIEFFQHPVTDATGFLKIVVAPRDA